jgi:MoaA/NifB/PqqE/SkfB family radical SAM enzyme
MCLIAFEKGNTNIKKAFDGNPIWAYLSITDHCDKNCSWCYAKTTSKLGEMKIEDFNVILNKCKEIGIRQISFSGGEPTLHPNINQFIDMSTAIGFKTHLLTHGLTSQFSEIVDMMLPLHQVQFNWNMNSYRSLLPIIKRIKSKNWTPVIAVTIVGSDENIQHIDDLLSAAVDNEVNKIRIWDQVGFNKTSKTLSIRDYYELVKPGLLAHGYTNIQSYDPEVQDDDIDVKIDCLMTSKSTLFISANGDIVPCLCSGQTDKILNLIESSVSSILQIHNQFCDKQQKNHCFARDF